MRRYILARPAKESLRSITRYTDRTWGREQRVKYLAALNHRFNALAAQPEKGRVVNTQRPDLRCVKEGKHLIFYFIGDNRIIIVDLLHENMDVAAHMERWTKGV